MKTATAYWTRLLPSKLAPSKLVRSKLVASLLVAVLILSASSVMAAERSLSFAVRGVVADVLVKAGDKVSKGSPLAKLDTTLHAARVASSAAALKSAAAELDKATADLERTQQLYDDLSASGENLETAKLDLIKATATHARAKSRSTHATWVFGRGTLKAPFAGTVTSVPGYPGMVVNPRSDNPPVVVIDAP